MSLNILIVGVGGQGTLLASRVLGKYAELKNFDCKLSEVHGMAQRGGSVVTHVKMGEKIYSPVISEGSADVILAFEMLEANRYIHFLKKDGLVVINSQKILPMPVVAGQVKYPDNLDERLKKVTDRIIYADALKAAEECGNIKTLNIIVLGVLCKNLNLDVLCLKKAIKETVPEKLTELNLKAFEKGYSI